MDDILWAHDGEDNDSGDDEILDMDLSDISHCPSDDPITLANGTIAPERLSEIITQTLFTLTDEWIGEAGWPSVEAIARLAHNGTPITDATMLRLLEDYELVDATGALLSDDHAIIIRACTELRPDGTMERLQTPY